VRSYAVAIGEEFRTKGANAVLGPGVDLVRSPYGGRSPETLVGEEPFLGAPLVAAYVSGLRSVGVGTVMKHFSANNQETGRWAGLPRAINTQAGRRTMHEAHYVPVSAGISAGAASVMCAYNLVNGTPACGNEWLLDQDLMGTLGFDGYVVSDWTAITDAKQAARTAVHMNMPGIDNAFGCPGILNDAQRNDKATHVLRGTLKVLAGLSVPDCIIGCEACTTCRNASCVPLIGQANSTSPAHVAVANAVATDGAVLVKNSASTLPIPNGATVAVVGSVCDADHSLHPTNSRWNLGDYYVVGGSGRVISYSTVSIWAGLQAKAAAHSLTLVSSLSDNVDEAITAMSGASIVITCGGGVGQEDIDRSRLTLDQHGFLEALAVKMAEQTAPPPLVVVALAPGPLAVGGWGTYAQAALVLFMSGQETGTAVAQLLTGESVPSGRLPVTLYADESQVDGRMRICTDRSRPCTFTEGAHVGWRALENVPVAFPFGHGLSYSSFTYAWGSAVSYAYATTGALARPNVTFSVSITNAGSYAAREVVQVYLRSDEPLTTLRAFEKTATIAPGASATLSFTLPPSSFNVYDYVTRSMAPLRSLSAYTLLVGASSRDIRLQQALS